MKRFVYVCGHFPIHLTMAETLIFIYVVLLFGSFLGDVQSLAHMQYDHSFTSLLLTTPLEPQYGGGIVVNPKLDQGSKGWTQVGNKNVEIRQANDGNKFVVATRAGNQTCVVQNFQLDKDKLYTFSAWVQSSYGNAYVRAMFKTSNENKVAGWVTAKGGGWSMLKGGLVVNVTGPAELYFDSNGTSTADIWVDNISLQPFTYEEWRSHQDKSIEKVRKGKVIFHIMDEHAQAISDATVSIKQTRPNFPFGSAMSRYILQNPKYAEWFISRFKYYTVFENEMKWLYIERNGPYKNYTMGDNMLSFAESHGLAVRGHTIHWGAYKFIPPYLMNITLTREIFQPLVEEHTNSIVNRYKGKLMHWDVVNENMHNKFFDTFLGADGSTHQYKKVNEIDPNALLFLNEYNTIELSNDGNATSWKYLEKINQLRKEGYGGHLGIGVQGHFTELNLPYIRSSLDILESAKLPIWITELDVANQTYGNLTIVATYLEEIMRELHAHPSVQGIMLWAAMWNSGGRCWRMCLTNTNFVNLPTGDVVDKILAEWTHASGIHGVTNDAGSFETSLFHGEYEAQITLQGTVAQSKSVKFKLAPSQGHDVVLPLNIYVPK